MSDVYQGLSYLDVKLQQQFKRQYSRGGWDVDDSGVTKFQSEWVDVLDKLGEAIPFAKMAIVEAATATGSPIQLVIASLISAVSAASIGGCVVKIESRREVSPGLIVFAVADSGVGKSGAFGVFNDPIASLESEWAKEHPARKKQRDAEIEVAKEEIKELKLRLRREIDQDEKHHLQQKLVETIKKLPDPIARRRLIVTDATWTALVKLQNESPAIYIASDEGGSVFAGPTMRNLSGHCNVWDCTLISSHRAEGATDSNGNSCGTTGLFMQPEVFASFVNDPRLNARKIGYLARSIKFSATREDRLQPFEQQTDSRDSINRVVNLLIARLNEAWVIWESGNSKFSVQWTSDALSLWRSIESELKKASDPGGRMEAIPDFTAKAAENIARIAAAFAYVLTQDGVITAPLIEFAKAIILNSLEEYLEIFSPEACQKRLGEALHAYLSGLEEAGIRVIAKNYVLKHANVTHLRNKEALERAIYYLKKKVGLAEPVFEKTKFLVLDGYRGWNGEIFWTEEMMRLRRQ